MSPSSNRSSIQRDGLQPGFGRPFECQGAVRVEAIATQVYCGLFMLIISNLFLSIYFFGVSAPCLQDQSK